MPAPSVNAALRYIRTLFAGRKAEGQSDQYLLDQFVAQHDESAFTALLQRHGPMAMGVCMRILGDEHLAEDAMQATFLVLALKAGAIRKRGSVASWLYGVAIRLSRKVKAQAIRAGQAVERAGPEPPATSVEASRREEKEVLDEELERLPDKYRLPLLLCYFEGRTQEEAAAHLGWTPGQVKGLLDRGRERLRFRLLRRGVTLSAAGAALLTHTTLSAAVPRKLAVFTVEAALNAVSGKTLAGCGVSEAVATLAMGELIMGPKKMLLIAALVLLTGTVALAAGMWASGRPEPDGVDQADVALQAKDKKGKKAKEEPKKLEVDLGGGVKMRFVRIEPGKFTMGSPKSEQDYIRNEFGDVAGDYAAQEKQHKVEITRPFYMGVYTVTQEQYEQVIGKNPSFFKGPQLPVETVSWTDAMEFCANLSKKLGKTVDLPTEAEWEYACRAGTKRPFHFGNSLSSKQANFHGDFPYGGAPKGVYLEKTTNVGSYEANAFGLYDMHGNVWQWIKDWYKRDYYSESPLRDPQGPDAGTGRLLRGSCYGDGAWKCRSASRHYSVPEDRTSLFGFRVVLRPELNRVEAEKPAKAPDPLPPTDEKKTADNKEGNKEKDEGDPADQAVIDRLIQVLKDPATPDEQRLSACEALGKRGTKAQRAAPELVKYLGQVLEKKVAVYKSFEKKGFEENAPDGDELTVIVRATLATGASGKEYTASLTRIMNLRLVGKKGVADKKGGVHYTLEDPRPIFALVGETLGQLGTQYAFSALQKAAKVGSPSRSAAIVGLARIANGADKILKANAEVELQVLAESDADAKIRGEAARSNGVDPAVDEAVTDRLIDIVKDAASSKEQRLSACEALGKRGTKAKRAAPELAKYLGQALEGKGGAFEEELRKILRAAIATGANGKEYTASLDRIFYVGLNRTAADQTPIIYLAGETLGQLGTEDAFAFLQKAAKREKHIRSAAIAGFASAAKSQDKTLKAKAKVELQVLAETDPDVQIRAEAVRAIALIEGRVKDDGKNVTGGKLEEEKKK
jgi:RNA polymerase sigma factor (sigma-70 family)